MQCSRTFLFQMCLSLLASTGSCTCKPTDNNEVRGSEAGGGGASDDDGASARLQRRLEQDLAREEEDAGSRLESLLGTMKEGFLRKLNLSDVPQESAKIQPPQFMMELYNKYASNSTAIPQSDVIRSFTVQDIGHSWRNGSRSGHRLLFNVSLPGHEKVTAAQLRLFLAHGGGGGPRPDGSSCNNKATVKVYEVDRRPRDDDDEAGLGGGGEPHAAARLHLLEGKEVAGTSWEMFDVTRAVLSWARRSGGGGGGLAADQQLEVVAAGGVAVSASVGGNGSAALIVFSDDLGSRRRETKKELKEMILHEEAAILYSGDRREAGGAAAAAGQLPNNELPEEEEEEMEALPLSPHHPRRRRRRRRKAEPREYCRRTSLKVNFKDIGWDSWIVAPPEYDAFECRGLCYHPLTDESTPSKHALIQTLVNVLNPRRANMACCVPIRLDPITVMYQENGRLTIRYLYEEMKVAECGCR